MKLKERAQAAQHWCACIGLRGQRLDMAPWAATAGMPPAEQQWWPGAGADSARLGKIIAIKARQTKLAKRPLAVCAITAIV